VAGLRRTARACVRVYVINAYKMLVVKLKRKSPIGRPRYRWEDNINMDLKQPDGVHWIQWAQDRTQWRALTNTLLKRRGPKGRETLEQLFKTELHDSQSRVTVKCGHESGRTRKQEWLCWRGPAAIYLTNRLTEQLLVPPRNSAAWTQSGGSYTSPISNT
jgi:hypothetical protein